MVPSCRCTLLAPTPALPVCLSGNGSMDLCRRTLVQFFKVSRVRLLFSSTTVLVFYCCHTITTKSSLGRKSVILLLDCNMSLKEAKAGAQDRSVEAATETEAREE